MRTTATRGGLPLVKMLRSRGLPKTAHGSAFSPGGRYLALCGFLVASFVMGGGARADILSLVILRPLAVLACGFAVLTLDRNTIREHRGILAWFAVVVGYVALSLVPLPPALWQALPGRGPLAASDALAGLTGTWRPFAMVPDAGFNALFALIVPAAVLLLGIQVPRHLLVRTLPLVLGLCIASGLLGLFQVVGPERGPLYLYRVTNDGAAVGLFANRNHAAVFAAGIAPLATTWLLRDADERWRMAVALGAIALLVPLAIAGGSRAGLITGVGGLIGAAAILVREKAISGPERRTLRRAVIGAGAVAAILSIVFVFMARAASVDRLLAAEQGADLRFQAWPVVLDSAWKYFPWGSGAGSFVETYQIDEPSRLIDPSYFNHAHNDLLEVFATTAVPGTLLMLVALVAIARLALRAWFALPAARRSIPQTTRVADALARLAALLFAILGIASLVDYPLRTPSLAALVALLYLWLRLADRDREADVTVDSGGELDNPRRARAARLSRK